MLPELIRKKKNKGNRQKKWKVVRAFYLLLLVFEMMLLVAVEFFLIRCWTVGVSWGNLGKAEVWICGCGIPESSRWLS